MPGAVYNTAPLTAVLLPEKPALSLDRLSFCANWRGRFQESLEAFELWSRTSPDVLESRMVPFPYRYQVKLVSGMDLRVRDKASELKDLRFEFNPSKIPLWQKTINSLLPTLKDIHLTRLDFAVDYKQDLGCMFFEAKTATKTVLYRDRSGKLETAYLGAADSPVRYRIYNKAIEQGQPGPWWRIECQLRFRPNDNWMDAYPFQDMAIGTPSPLLKIQDKAMLHYLREYPQAWGELKKDTKQRYRNLLKKDGLIALDPHPSAVFADSAHDIINQLDRLFSRA